MSAETTASTAVTRTAGRQPQPSATQAPTASGPTSPMDDPTPFASVRAADDARPCRIARPGLGRGERRVAAHRDHEDRGQAPGERRRQDEPDDAERDERDGGDDGGVAGRGRGPAAA